MSKSLLSLMGVAALLSSCTLIPTYERPDLPVPNQYPQGNAYRKAERSMPASSFLEWEQVFSSPALQQLIQLALTHNRDLRVAALNVQAYAAQYRIQRADMFPDISANATGSRGRTPADLSTARAAEINSQYATNIGINAYELDLFGRIRSLSDQALEIYLSSEEARRATHISLVASVANAYLTLEADRELLQLTRETLATYEESLYLTTRSNDVGIGSALDLSQARTSVEGARASLASYQRLVAQDENALALLIGTQIPSYLPASTPLSSEQVAQVPEGLPSDLLARRPDVLRAEHALKAANANIGAARAAFFPSISLTASAGSASADLGALFKGGQGAWTFVPNINLPIFNAGSLEASLDYSKIQRQIEVENYEKAIQIAFQEVANGLAARKTYRDQLAAQRDLVTASQDYYRLAEHRYRTGVDSNLTLLDAQRSLYSAEQTLISDRLAQLQSEVNLFKALGGGWGRAVASETAVR